VNLEQLVQRLQGQEPGEVSACTVEMPLADIVPSQLLMRLAKLQRLNLLSGDVLMSLVMQAPVDPLGLIELLMAQIPGWVFSSVDCSVLRVLARTEDKAVAAAIRIDLLDDSVETLVINREKQLTSYKKYDTLAACEKRQPGPWILEQVQKLCDEAMQAAARELGS